MDATAFRVHGAGGVIVLAQYDLVAETHECTDTTTSGYARTALVVRSDHTFFSRC